MQRAVFAGCLAVMMLLIFSALVLPPAAHGESPAPQAEPAATPAEPEPEATEPAPAAVTPSYDERETVRLLDGEETLSLSLAEYLEGVVLGEMPASVPAAAREAQAVAARTFTLRRRQSPKHEDADVCTDSSCCQQYLSPAAARERLGEAYEEAAAGAWAAVAATDGLVAVYEGRLIDAVYFSNSGGRTEAAVAVWGSDVPYLQSVESPGEGGGAAGRDTVAVALEDFRAAILQARPEADLSGDPAGWFGAVTYTAGGGVDTMEIGGVAFGGTELRSLFSLRSARFTVSVEGETVQFVTQGYGHRVGLSQYGAKAMAEDGADFREILLHYYTGISVVPAGQIGN